MSEYAPNANWTAAIEAARQSPIYYVAFDGLTTKHYSTGPVKSAAVTKKQFLQEPSGGGVTLDIIAGVQTIQTASFEILDVDDDLTDLISTNVTGGRSTGSLSTLINRKVTIYGGDASLAEADYAPIYVGRVVGVSMNRDLTGYVFKAASTDYLLDGQIMVDATSTKPATIRGNVVNVYWSILTGTFDTGHATFPLNEVSSAGASSTAPTGLGLATSLIDETALVTQRDTWHVDDVIEVRFKEPVNAKTHLQEEFFRIFQCFPAISGDGLIGLKFHAQPVSPADAVTLTEDDIIAITKWDRQFGDHLNKFTFRGDYDVADNEFDTVLYNTETAEDTTDQSNTAETIEYVANSKWLRTAPLDVGPFDAEDYQAVEISEELAGRMRLRYLHTPVLLGMFIHFNRRNLVQGAVVAVTHPDLPDLFTGTRGVADKLMTVIGIAPDYAAGMLNLTLLDTGIKRYGGISPGGTSKAYTAASAKERNTFTWVGAAADNHVGTADPGYYLL